MKIIIRTSIILLSACYSCFSYASQSYSSGTGTTQTAAVTSVETIAKGAKPGVAYFTSSATLNGKSIGLVAYIKEGNNSTSVPLSGTYQSTYFAVTKGKSYKVQLIANDQRAQVSVWMQVPTAPPPPPPPPPKKPANTCTPEGLFYDSNGVPITQCVYKP
jgi:hypothetical protein